MHLTLHEVLPLLRAGGGDVELQLVYGDSVRDGKVVDALVGGLARQELPKHDAVAPYVAGL